MKKRTLFTMASTAVLIAAISVTSCNNDSDDKVTVTDTSTTTRMENVPAKTMETDSATKEFLMKAADGGMAEVNAGQMAQEKGTSPAVKRFANMMIQDHSNANDQIKSLAAARNVMLPSAPSEEHQKMATMVGEKTGKNFDKAYMDMMLDGHKKTITLFEKAATDSKDEEVKSFINSTIPKLKMHLDSVNAVRKTL